MSSLKEHFEKVRAEKLARQRGETFVRQTQPQTLLNDANSPHPDDTSPLELKFFNDWEQIVSIQSSSTRNERKAEFLPSYQGYIDGVLASGVGIQNDMLLKLMVWSLDTHAFATATDIAEFALLNDMAMPEPFSRDVATFFAEQLATEIIKNNAEIDSDLLQKAVNITSDHDMPDEVRAKLYRALGEVVADDDVQQAISAYEMALKLDSNVGVKTDLARLKKSLES